MEVTATKQDWLLRQRVIDNINHSRLSDPLIAACWDAVSEIRPIQKSVQEMRQSLLEKYAMKEGGEVQTVEKVREDLLDADSEGEGEEEADLALQEILSDTGTVQTQQGRVLMEDKAAFEGAVEDALQETVTLDVVTVPVQEALESDLPMSALQEHFGWLIE